MTVDSDRSASLLNHKIESSCKDGVSVFYQINLQLIMATIVAQVNLACQLLFVICEYFGMYVWRSAGVGNRNDSDKLILAVVVSSCRTKAAKILIERGVAWC